MKSFASGAKSCVAVTPYAVRGCNLPCVQVYLIFSGSQIFPFTTRRFSYGSHVRRPRC
jgi:hypothetical protein